MPRTRKGYMVGPDTACVCDGSAEKKSGSKMTGECHSKASEIVTLSST